MIRYFGARLGQGVIALWAVVTIVFFLARSTGDAAALMAPPDATPEQIEAIRVSMGLDRPIFVQYGAYLLGLLRLDLGDSHSYRAPVADLVGPAMLQTGKLALTAFVIAVVLGTALGLLAAYRVGSLWDHTVRMFAVVGQSVPSFWLGMLLVMAFSVGLGWLPPFGADSLVSVILPAAALAAFPLASFARLTRSAVLEVLGKDQTTFLRAKGIAPLTMLIHVLRNASLPTVTLAGIQLGVLFSGTIVIENLFAWPGVGQLAIQAISAKDFSLIQGIVLINTIVFVGLLFLVDLAYGVLDPRVRASRSRRPAPAKAVTP